MSGYADMARDMELDRWIAEWAPADEMPEVTEENARFWFARMKKAEHDLEELRGALRVIKGSVS